MLSLRNSTLLKRQTTCNSEKMEMVFQANGTEKQGSICQLCHHSNELQNRLQSKIRRVGVSHNTY